jgi:hypothetical protein
MARLGILLRLVFNIYPLINIQFGTMFDKEALLLVLHQ